MEKHVCLLARALDRRVFEPIVVVLQRNGPLESLLLEQGIVPRHLSITRPYNPKTIFILRRLLRREKPQIVHTYLCGFDILVGLASFGLPGMRLIFSRRELADWRKKWHWLVERLGDWFAHRIVACSEAVRKRTLQKEKPDPAKVITVYNGVAIQEDLSVSGVRDYASEGVVFGMISNFGPEKDQITVLKAFRTLFGKYPAARLTLVGEGDRIEEAKRCARELGVASRVSFPGASLDVAGVLRTVDIFVFASIGEGLPNVILEAFATGRPVVATNVGGVPEIVHDGETGLLVPPRNPEALALALEHLMQNASLRKTLSGNASRLIREKFSIPIMRDSYQKLYREWAQT